MTFLPFATAAAATALSLSAAISQEIPQPASAIQREEPGAPVVVLETSLGAITLELDPVKAPKTTENFLSYVKTGFYDDTIFHRVISDFMVQGGGYAHEPEGTPAEKETRPPVASESKNGLSNLKGTVAMARKEDSADSATSQFFINTVDNTRLDPPSIDGVGYTVFGKVTSGMDVVEKIQAVPTTIRKMQVRLGNGSLFGVDLPNVPVEDVVIKKAVYQNDPSAPPETPERQDTEDTENREPSGAPPTSEPEPATEAPEPPTDGTSTPD